MAVNFTTLADCIRDSDSKRFLKVYLQLVLDGKSLVVPTSLDAESIQNAWAEILHGVPGGYTPAFLKGVSDQWLSLVVACDETLDEEFASKAIALLGGPEGDEPVAKETNTVSAVVTELGEIEKLPTQTVGPLHVTPIEVKPVSEEERRRGGQPNLSEIAASISESYFEDGVAPVVRNTTELDALIRQALNVQSVDVFLIHYLSLMIQSVTMVFPVSSVLDIIYGKWRDILMTYYGVVPQEKFLRDLSIRWAYLVNQKGLPVGRKPVKDMLNLLKFEQRDPQKKSVQSSGRSATVGGVKKRPTSILKAFLKMFGLSVLLCGLFLGGCRSREVQRYSVPVAYRDLSMTVLPVAEGVPSASEIVWIAPEGWEVLPPAQMRLAGFKKSVDGHDVELTVAAFPGSVGTLTDNVNRWRSQLGLSPVDEAGARALIRVRAIKGHDFQVLSLKGPEKIEPGGTRRQMQTAMLSYAGKMWFFKLTGDDGYVDPVLPEFEQFLISLEFKDEHADH
jgi:hypothetical protein